MPPYFTKQRRRFKLPRFLRPGEAERFLEAAATFPPAVFAYAATLYYTGLRRNEARMLDMTDVDLEADTILVRYAKGDRERMIPLHPRLKTILLWYLEECTRSLPGFEAPLFLNALGRRPCYSLTGFWVRWVSRRAGLSGVGCHWLRHTAATMMLRKGANIRAVQRVLGHLRLETTALYTHVLMEDLRDAVAKIG